MKIKANHWRHHIDAQKTSDLNFKAYCKRESLSYATFQYWRNKFQEKEKPVLIPVQITTLPDVERNSVICKLMLNNGRYLEFYDKALVKALFCECA